MRLKSGSVLYSECAWWIWEKLQKKKKKHDGHKLVQETNYKHFQLKNGMWILKSISRVGGNWTLLPSSLDTLIWWCVRYVWKLMVYGCATMEICCRYLKVKRKVIKCRILFRIVIVQLILVVSFMTKSSGLTDLVRQRPHTATGLLHTKLIWNWGLQ